MARCGCSGSSCGCLLVAGAGVTITGVGSAANPFTITAAPGGMTGLFQVADTGTIDLTRLGSGTTLDPYILTADASMTTADLADVNDSGGPSSGDTIIWVGGGGGHFEYAPAASAMVPVASVNATGTHVFDTPSVSGPATIRLNLTGNTELSIPDGATGTAYTIYLDVVPNGFTLGVFGGGTFAAVDTATQVVIPLFWTGLVWASQWASE